MRLISRGADTTTSDTCGQTVLEAAEASGNQEVSELLRRLSMGS